MSHASDDDDDVDGNGDGDDCVDLFFIVRGVCTQPPCFCIIMEYCPYGQLYDILRTVDKLPPRLLFDWSRQIANGMAYLHSHKIIHRDLKSPKLAAVNYSRGQ